MEERNTTQQTARNALGALLVEHPPWDFASLSDTLAAQGVADIALLRHLLDVGMRAGAVNVLVSSTAEHPGPWYTSGDGQACDPWAGLDGARLYYRRGSGTDGVWAQMSSPYRLRHLRLVERDGARCQLCGRLFLPDYQPEQDHRTPRSEGGGNELENLQLAHKVCNMVKGTRAGWRLPDSDEVTVWFDPVDGAWREVLSKGVYT